MGQSDKQIYVNVSAEKIVSEKKSLKNVPEKCPTRPTRGKNSPEKKFSG